MMKLFKVFEPTLQFALGWALAPFVALMVIIVPDFGIYEGELFPVIKDFHIVAKSPTSDGYIHVEVEFDKVRACLPGDHDKTNNKDDRDALDLSIQIIPGVWERFNVSYPEDNGFPYRSRPIGSWHTTWIVDAPAQYIYNPIHIDTYHLCWGKDLWQTKTQLLKQDK